MATVDFYFDVFCPYAYIASTHINQICAKYNVIPTWKPVSLQELYRLSNDGQKKKDFSKIPVCKRTYSNRDQLLQRQRANIKHTRYPNPWPVSTFKCMTILTAIAMQNNNNNNKLLMQCANVIFHAFWFENQNVSKVSVLKQILSKNVPNMDINIDAILSNDKYTNALLSNTKDANKQYRIFGVPSFVVNKKEMFWGNDRLSFVKQMLNLNGKYVYPPINRIKYDCVPNASENEIDFFFDFSSPWAFLGFKRLYELKKFAKTINFKPILLGAVFREVGTANAPALELSKFKRDAMTLDMNRWVDTIGVKLKWTNHFPLRTVLPLRVFIIDNRCIDCIYRAAWQWNINIGDPIALRNLLDDHGFDGDMLIKRAKSDLSIKQVLKDNTTLAIEKGIFGVPTYVVNQKYDCFIWGQDKLDYVKDLCCGWNPVVSKSDSNTSKL